MDSLPCRVHCIGAAGAGLLPLAICLKQKGHIVSAEDDDFTDDARKILTDAGIGIVDTFDVPEENGLVVHSSAVKNDHASLQKAISMGWSVMRRGECLAALVEGKSLVAIVGSHGKSTTCGMLIDLFSYLKIEFSYCLGALFDAERSPGHWSDAGLLIAEIDESDGTIEGFDPEVTLILNADFDHHNRYASYSDYLDVFKKLCHRTTKSVISLESLKSILEDSINPDVRSLWIQDEPGNSWNRKTVAPSFSSLSANLESDSWNGHVNRSGDFNLINAIFGLAATSEFAKLSDLPDCIEFSDLKRRQSGQYLSPSLRIVDDYAHHPDEIGPFLNSLELAEDEELHVVFQPHRYSRTYHLKNEFAQSLSKSDFLYLVDVYAFDEEPLSNDVDESLHEVCVAENIACQRVENTESLFGTLSSRSREHSMLVVFLGAGSTHQVAEEIADRFAEGDHRWGSLYRGLGRVATMQSRIIGDEPLATKTTLRVGGPAELYFEPSNRRELQAVFKISKTIGRSVFPLGRGSNLVVPDKGVRGLVVRLSHPFWRQCAAVDEKRIKVGAGVRIKELCGYAIRQGLKGFEFLEGIPGSVGGALRMNAGAMGGWMFDVVESVTFLTKDGAIHEAPSAELNVGYRRCDELVDAIAIEAVLVSVESGHKQDDLRRSIDVYQQKRKESQPRDPSAGCIFKNPGQDSAGRIIEELGLKGAAVGGAEISQVHGNFIVNTGGAKSEDVIELVKLVRREALNRMQVELEPEALLYGQEWKDALS